MGIHGNHVCPSRPPRIVCFVHCQWTVFVRSTVHRVSAVDHVSTKAVTRDKIVFQQRCVIVATLGWKADQVSQHPKNVC